MRTTELLASLVAEGISSAQREGALPPAGDAEVTVERPQQPEHGDYSSNVALRLARSMRKAPMAIGEAIVAGMPVSEAVSRSWVAAPGFINLELAGDWLRSQVTAIRQAGPEYGSSEEGAGTRVQVEFVSVNPTGPLHVGHARGAVIGSGLAKVLAAAGYEVQREYYVNDAGNQMRTFRESLHARYRQAAGEAAQMPATAYEGEYLRELASEIYRAHGRRFLDMAPEDAQRELEAIGLDQILAVIKEDLALLGVTYDNWFSEQSLFDSGEFDEVMGLLGERQVLVDRDGARWFASSQLGEDRENVLIRSGGGGPTYLATDIAYHYGKFVRRGFDRVIDVWGADHHGHVPAMKAVVRAFDIDPDRLTIILNQIVSFKEGDETRRFSKRQGVIVTVRELVDEVGRDACRYIFMSRSPEAQMEFDLDLVKQQSSENPVYYVQYAHARLSSILRTAQERGIDFEDGDTALLTDPMELQVVRQLIVLPEVLHVAADRLEPHHLPHYSMEVARALQRFYEECRVVSSDPADLERSKARLHLVDAARIVLARVLDLMGMSAPERM